LIHAGQQHIDRQLQQTDVQGSGVMNGLVAETQRPLLERGEAALRVGDFQGAIEAFNFALAADQALDSPLCGRLLWRRGQAHDGLGNARQALLDFRLATTRLAVGSAERADAEAGAARLATVGQN
jgi:tetratricopeptide (TPR) repeat protein